MMLERDYHLDQADRHIAETKQLVARQREVIAVLKLLKRPTETALSMLEALEKSLELFESHRLNIDQAVPAPRLMQRAPRRKSTRPLSRSPQKSRSTRLAHVARRRNLA
jgi:hypothetical protein